MVVIVCMRVCVCLRACVLERKLKIILINFLKKLYRKNVLFFVVFYCFESGYELAMIRKGGKCIF